MKARKQWLAPLSAWLARHRRRVRRRRLRLITGGLQRMPLEERRATDTPRALRTVEPCRVKAS
jgi:hypothetical protein